jgi:hypothetical protein
VREETGSIDSVGFGTNAGTDSRLSFKLLCSYPPLLVMSGFRLPRLWTHFFLRFGSLSFPFTALQCSNCFPFFLPHGSIHATKYELQNEHESKYVIVKNR